MKKKVLHSLLFLFFLCSCVKKNKLRTPKKICNGTNSEIICAPPPAYGNKIVKLYN